MKKKKKYLYICEEETISSVHQLEFISANWIRNVYVRVYVV